MIVASTQKIQYISVLWPFALGASPVFIMRYFFTILGTLNLSILYVFYNFSDNFILFSLVYQIYTILLCDDCIIIDTVYFQFKTKRMFSSQKNVQILFFRALETKKKTVAIIRK